MSMRWPLWEEAVGTMLLAPVEDRPPATESVTNVTADISASEAAEVRLGIAARSGEPERLSGRSSVESNVVSSNGRAGRAPAGAPPAVSSSPTVSAGSVSGDSPRACAHARRSSKFSLCSERICSWSAATCVSSSSTYCFLRLRLIAADSRLRRIRFSRLSSAPSSSSPSPSPSTSPGGPSIKSTSPCSESLDESGATLPRAASDRAASGATTLGGSSGVLAAAPPLTLAALPAAAFVAFGEPPLAARGALGLSLGCALALAVLATGLSGVIGGSSAPTQPSGESHALPRAEDSGSPEGGQTLRPASDRSAVFSSVGELPSRANSISHMSTSSTAKSKSADLPSGRGGGGAPEASCLGLELPEPEELLLSGASRGTTSGSSAIICFSGGTLLVLGSGSMSSRVEMSVVEETVLSHSGQCNGLPGSDSMPMASVCLLFLLVAKECP
mmetsp:Transcript_53555/g.138445  ORF Transcript_53555/g.138445 Transcript_53555/m.138445 type:complete len:445 (-) Transcript_53555:7-1341(-)